MDATEREGLKEQLGAMAAGRGDGIDLNSQDRWVIKRLKNPMPFFHHLHELIPGDSILYFEGCAIIPEVVAFYEKHRAHNAVCVTRDTIYPVPAIFHVSLAPGVIELMIQFLNNHPKEECFDHVKAYHDGTLLFTFHDAFDGWLLVSDVILESKVRAFCEQLNAEYHREQNINKRDPEQLRRFLWALENPQKLRMNWPWWKKALFFWKRSRRNKR